ncbi:non-ribosomal peptide synthetase [Streptantibioticus cattleyicolor]|uniref:Nonribosomal peptide synthetase n=1 Tax=Streptantibioticus cattleyicolor (strain ATCC 35852 / DSM 46488 / JCM 4925 / NBRC 14057 / NRRL 8057) TaxID=1003195 RepID=F8JMR5_STREN|nr:non-ribosomal peptide synthetase [Streptantibioticus cattleyicolor]AEW99300.1 nonribosomal peptide synthetase [Streptantibioticus cattleyicolor NRRL 8057 = DSM 46488]CCB71661.1 Nonribosomal peptide synthetase [Streptantibioticus cattleyicolor NRRL 8057 = DSM 46488]
MPADEHPAFRDLVQLLRYRAATTPEATAYVFVDDAGEHPVGYAELDRRVRQVAAGLREGPPAERALLLYPPGREYVIGFWACLYAGITAVPAYPPGGGRRIERVLDVAADCGAALALTDTASLAAFGERWNGHPGLRGVRLCSTESAPDVPADAWQPPRTGPDTVAFLQYTSGSTARPKGVVLHHGHLLHNAAALAGALSVGPEDSGVSWLPPYHDMGLIGGILQPVFSGFPCVLLPPSAFVRHPGRWLELISRHRATISAAPDFGYAECVRRVGAAERTGLDLSGWRHALVGAEPVRAATLDAFAGAFAARGFRRSAFYPCYGLAEATLFVTGGTAGAGPTALTVDRDGLGDGRLVPADGDGHPVLVACGAARTPDRVAVVDPATARELPDGDIGEVWISGPTVAAGYFGDDGATEETFRARRSDGDQADWLRTGDLGAVLDGHLYLTGRAKDVVVVRGRNHHPQDVEQTAERAHPLLMPGRGALFALDDGATPRVVLVHEVVRGHDPAALGDAATAVRAAVATAHGLRLADVALVRPGSVPRTSSGKVRRSACRQAYLAGELDRSRLDGDARSGGGDGELPSAGAGLRALAAEALEVPADVLRDDLPLVAQGLDSLAAARLAAAVEGATGTRVAVREFLEPVPLRELAARMVRAPRDAVPWRPGAAPATSTATSDQHRLWLLDQAGAGPAYLVTAALRLPGRRAPELLTAALTAVTRRHEALRTTYHFQPDGTLVQTVRAWTPPPLRHVDLTVDARRHGARTAVQRWARDQLAEPFDLARETPLRAALLRLGDDDHALVLTVHHIAVDGASLAVLLREAEAVCAAGPDGEPRLPEAPRYRDLAAWRREVTEASAAEDAAHWRRALAGTVPLELPADRPRPVRPSHRGGLHPVAVSPAGSAALAAFARAEGTTAFTVLLAGYAAVLARWSGQPDVVVAVPTAAGRPPGAEGVVGFTTLTLPVRVPVGAAATFRDLVRATAAAWRDADRHRDTPLDVIAREVSAAGGPPGADLARAAFVLGVPLPPWRAPGPVAEAFEVPLPAAQFDLSLHLTATPDGGCEGRLAYATDLFDAGSAARVADAFGRLLDRAVARPDEALDAHDLIAPEERRRLLEEFSGASVPPPGDLPAAKLFARQVAATPSAPAVLPATGGPPLTYRELARRSGRLADRLRALGAGPGTVVGVHLPYGAGLVTALLAILEADACYLPLDAEYPAARLRLVAEDARPAVLLGCAALDSASLAPDGTATLLLDPSAEPDGTPDAAAAPPARPARPDDLAFLIYTSGSTGTPKGVMVTRAGLANQLAAKRSAQPLGPDDRVLLHTACGFDISVSEMLWPLVTGACLVTPDGACPADLERMAALCAEHHVTACYFVPSVLRELLAVPGAAGHLAGVRQLQCAGEELTPQLAASVHRLLPGARLYNVYGPAEATIEVTVGAVDPGVDPGGKVPVGRPVAGARLYVLDAGGRPVPVGVAGEVCVGGVQVSRGYLGRPAATAERFVPDPAVPGGRLYRTGDRGRWRPDGRLEILGRLDRETKIRGQRVDPGEIEAVLRGHPAVSAAAVTVTTDGGGPPRLVAHVVPEPPGPAAVPADLLRGHLRQRLPRHMVPEVFVALPALPLGANGKTDLAALPAPPAARPDTSPDAAPRTPVERLVAAIWTDVLGVEHIGRHDDFFDLGGHSLLATRIAVRLRDTFGVDLTIADLLHHDLTVAALARAVEQRRLARTSAAELREALEAVRALSPAQSRALLGDPDTPPAP